MDNPRAALPGWCSASGQWSRRGPSRPSARHLSSAGFGTSGTGAGRSWEYRCNPCESKLTPSQNAQQIRDERGIGTRPSFRQVSPRRPADFETVLLDLGRVYRIQAMEEFLAPFREQQVLHDPPHLGVALQISPQVIVN